MHSYCEIELIKIAAWIDTVTSKFMPSLVTKQKLIDWMYLSAVHCGTHIYLLSTVCQNKSFIPCKVLNFLHDQSLINIICTITA